MTFRLPQPCTDVVASFGDEHAVRDALRARLAALPGVTQVGAISHLPYDDGLPNWATPYLREGDADVERAGTADTRAVLPGFFEAVDARLVEGRLFLDADDRESRPVAIVDDVLAARLWPGESAIGKRFVGDPQATGGPATTVTVIGVVRHLRHRQPTLEGREQIYYPNRLAQRNPMAFVIRGAVDPATLAPLVRQAIREVDARLAWSDIALLSDYEKDARASRRFAMILAGAFALAALLLTSMGVYGVTAYGVAVRTRELGVRQALGGKRPADTVFLGSGASV